MADPIDALELTLDEAEMVDLQVQSEAEDVNVAIEPTGSTRDKHPHRPAVPGLVSKRRRNL